MNAQTAVANEVCDVTVAGGNMQGNIAIKLREDAAVDGNNNNLSQMACGCQKFDVDDERSSATEFVETRCPQSEHFTKHNNHVQYYRNYC